MADGADRLERVRRAYHAVKSGNMSTRAASAAFGIPKSTLTDRVTHRIPLVKRKKTVLTTEEEAKFAEWAVNLARAGLGKTRKEFCTNIQSYLNQLGEPSLRFKNNNLPGKTWYYDYLHRHPELTEQRGRILASGTLTAPAPPTAQSSLPRPPLSSSSSSSSPSPLQSSTCPAQEMSDSVRLNCLESFMSEEVKRMYERRLEEGCDSKDDLMFNAWKQCKLSLSVGITPLASTSSSTSNPVATASSISDPSGTSFATTSPFNLPSYTSDSARRKLSPRHHCLNLDSLLLSTIPKSPERKKRRKGEHLDLPDMVLTSDECTAYLNEQEEGKVEEEKNKPERERKRSEKRKEQEGCKVPVRMRLELWF